MTPAKLDHCVIHVSEWERSNRFYTAVLGVLVFVALPDNDLDGTPPRPAPKRRGRDKKPA